MSHILGHRVQRLIMTMVMRQKLINAQAGNKGSRISVGVSGICTDVATSLSDTATEVRPLLCAAW